jgi:hypothetical protein
VATVKNQEEACRRQSPFFRPESGDSFTFEEALMGATTFILRMIMKPQVFLYVSKIGST